MNQKQIMEALLSGKKIRSKHWNDHCYICLDGDNIVDELGECNSIDLDGDQLSLWEIYQEPKKQVEKFLWNIKNINSWSLYSLYLTEHEVERLCSINKYKEYRKSGFSILVDED